MAEKTNGQQAGKGSGISKMEAVRRALGAMGSEATPSQLQPFIKSKFGITMTTDHISTYKGDIRRKAAGQAKSAARPAGTEATAPKASAPKASAPKTGIPGGVSLK